MEVPADFIQRAIQSDRDPSSRVEVGSQLIDEYDMEIYPDKSSDEYDIETYPDKSSDEYDIEINPDKSRQPVGAGGVQTKFNRPLIPNQGNILHIQPIPSQKRTNVSSPISNKQTNCSKTSAK